MHCPFCGHPHSKVTDSRVAESGIRGTGDVETLKAMGVDAILVGETLVRQQPKERKRKVQQLVRAGQEH